LAERNQIFNMSEAFHMLSKELSDMMLNPVSNSVQGCTSQAVRSKISLSMLWDEIRPM
jgi:hypothetical protein